MTTNDKVCQKNHPTDIGTVPLTPLTKCVRRTVPLTSNRPNDITDKICCSTLPGFFENVEVIDREDFKRFYQFIFSAFGQFASSGG